MKEVLLKRITVRSRGSKYKRYDIYLRKDQKAKLNRHHRRPKSQGGRTNPRNISVVDVYSHDMYHCLAAIAAKVAGVQEGSVHTVHVAYILSALYPIVQTLLCDPETRELKSPEQIIAEFNKIWLSPDEPMSEATVKRFGKKMTIAVPEPLTTPE